MNWEPCNILHRAPFPTYNQKFLLGHGKYYLFDKKLIDKKPLISKGALFCCDKYLALVYFAGWESTKQRKLNIFKVAIAQQNIYLQQIVWYKDQKAPLHSNKVFPKCFFQMKQHPFLIFFYYGKLWIWVILKYNTFFGYFLLPI